MADAGRAAPFGEGAVLSASTPPRAYFSRQWGLPAGVAALIAIVMMPQPTRLSIAGQHMLGVFAFAIIAWVTEAIEYAASSVILLAMMGILLGTAPDPTRPDRLLGTTAGLSAAMDGFTNPAVALIAASLVIAAAMAITGLDRRIAYKVISLVGTGRSRILIGTITVMAVLAFFVPTAAARVACLAPIILGIISALGIDKEDRVAGMLMMAVAYLCMIWAMGVATGAAQNVYVSALMERTIHVRISWIDWLVVGAPFSFALSVVLYFVLTKMMSPPSGAVGRDDSLSGSRVNLAAELPPMTAAEWRLLLFSILLLGFWATENKLHSLDSSTVAVAAVAAMFMPGIGVLTWKQVQPRVPWGILIQLGVGVGLGTALLKTGAAGWLAHFVVDEFAVAQLSIFQMLAVLWLFLIVIHLGFSSGSAMATRLLRRRGAQEAETDVGVGQGRR